MTFKQWLQTILALGVVLLMVWLAFYVLLAILVIGGLVGLVVAIRQFLRRQGILAPKEEAWEDGGDESDVSSATTIEVEYHELSEDDQNKQ